MAKKDLASWIADLQHEKPKKRIKACQELAKLGDTRAIPDLTTAYKNDEDEKVKAAAEAALLKFRALQPRPESQASVSPRLKQLRLLLGVTLIILLVLNGAYMLFGGSDDELANTNTTLRDRSELIDMVGNSLTEAETGALAIQAETAGQNCERSIKRPSATNLSAMEKHTYPDLAELVASEPYQAVFGFLETAYGVWKNNCNAGNLSDIGVQNQINDMANLVIDNLPGLQAILVTVDTEPAPTIDPELFGIPPTAAPTATFTPAPTPTLTPIAGIDYPTHIAALDSIVRKVDTAVIEFQGRWQAAIDGADVIDCRVSSFGMGTLAVYTLEPDQTGDDILDEAITLINEALTLTQGNLPVFAAQCPLEGGLLSAVDERLPELNTAAENIAAAKILLDSMRER